MPSKGLRVRRGTRGFWRVLAWTLLGSVVPGAGLVAAGRRVVGGVLLALTTATTLSVIAFAVFGDPMMFASRQILAYPQRLTIVAAAMLGLALGWAVIVIGTHISLRRVAELNRPQRALSAILVASVVGGGLAAAFVGCRDALLTRDALTSIFSTAGPLPASGDRPDGSGRGVDPWVGMPRINILLIGSDAGADRTGLRTDSLIVASIDTRTGDSTLFSLPRNLEHVPFPPDTQPATDFPQGFVCPKHACLINSLWQFGVEHQDTYYRGDKSPGLTATVQGVEQTLGLTIDYFAMVDLRGFMHFVDAIGGLTINVAQRIPVGGHRDPNTGIATGVTSYLEPGRQVLNGYQTLWFARSRSDSDDYERMRRQRCVIDAVIQQVDPRVVAVNLPAVLQAAKDNISTNIPLKDLDLWVTLTLRIKNAQVRSLPFTNAVVNPSNPDFARIQALVRDALRPGVTESSPGPHTPNATPTPRLDPLRAQVSNASADRFGHQGAVHHGLHALLGQSARGRAPDRHSPPFEPAFLWHGGSPSSRVGPRSYRLPLVPSSGRTHAAA